MWTAAAAAAAEDKQVKSSHNKNAMRTMAAAVLLNERLNRCNSATVLDYASLLASFLRFCIVKHLLDFTTPHTMLEHV